MAKKQPSAPGLRGAVELRDSQQNGEEASVGNTPPGAPGYAGLYLGLFSHPGMGTRSVVRRAVGVIVGEAATNRW